MIIKTPAKINLGLNIVERRPDGYHNLQTVFYPVPLYDTLEVTEMDSEFPSVSDCDIKTTGISVAGDEQQNLVCRAYRLLKSDFPRLPRLHIHLHKTIPTQAGMGGGSSDASAMLLLLNQCYNLQLSEQQLVDYAARLGADCPFFISSKPVYAEGIGELMHPVALSLSGWHIAIVRPDIPVPTREAFSHIVPRMPQRCCRDTIALPVEQWRDALSNDFEDSVFISHPELAAIKQQLYAAGATYAAMSGSGSALFGLFRQHVDVASLFPDTFTAFFTL